MVCTMPGVDVEVAPVPIQRSLQLGRYTPLAENASQMMHDPRWGKAVFVRDPLDRLVAAWQSECVTRWKAKLDMSPCPLQDASSLNLAAVVAAVEQSYKQDLMAQLPLAFRPQALLCATHALLKQYQLAGHFGTDLQSMLMRFVEEKTPYWTPTVGPHQNPPGVLQEYYSNDMARRVMKMYRIDYSLFSFPIATWVPLES